MVACYTLFMPYPMVKDVSSVEAMAAERFSATVNAVRVPRNLAGDFNAVATRLLSIQSNLYDGMRHFTLWDVQQERAKSQKLCNIFSYSAAERQALCTIENDMRKITELGYYATLRALNPDGGKESELRRFHQDAEIEDHYEEAYESLLCCYKGATTEFIRHEDGLRGFQSFFTPREGCEIFRFKNGDIWKHAAASSGDIKSFIHRAPPQDEIRLVLLGSRQPPKYAPLFKI